MRIFKPFLVLIFAMSINSVTSFANDQFDDERNDIEMNDKDITPVEKPQEAKEVVKKKTKKAKRYSKKKKRSIKKKMANKKSKKKKKVN